MRVANPYLVACLAATLLAGCGERAPALKDDLNLYELRSPPSPKCYMQAPIILVGKVDFVRQIARTQPALRIPEALLDPVEIELSVEHILKGAVSMDGHRIRIFGLLYSPKNTRQLGQPAFNPRPGQHRIIFARREGTRLRLFHDVVDYYFLRVRSGDHPSLDPDARTNPVKAISWLLLTLGPNYDSEGISKDLITYTYVARTISGEDYMRALLDRLASVSDSNIHHAAEELSKSFDADKRDGLSNSTLGDRESCVETAQ